MVQTSSPTFEVYGTLTLIPNGTPTLIDAQKLKAESTFDIAWTTVGDTLNTVDIEYSQDADANILTFDNPQPIEMAHDNSVGGGMRGAYTWTIPNTFNDDTVYLRIQPTGFANGFDESGSFKIMPDIRVLGPSGGEQWKISTQEDITWDIKGVVNSMKIRYSITGGAPYPNGAPYEIVTINPKPKSSPKYGPSQCFCGSNSSIWKRPAKTWASLFCRYSPSQM